jgi:putative OPT family oligopeptide transporter
LMSGGLLGVLFSIPLRRILLDLPNLPFPEGTAVGHVLRTSATGASQFKLLLLGGMLGSVVSLCQTGFAVLAERLPLWFSAKKTLFGISFGFDPVLIGAGYIVGPITGLTMFLGTVCGWLIGIPLLSHIYEVPAGLNIEASVMYLWSHYIRYVGVGTMLIAGIWTLGTLIKPLVDGMRVTRQAIKKNRAKVGAKQTVLRTEQDMPFKYLVGIFICLSVIIFFTLLYFISTSGFVFSGSMLAAISLFSTVYLMVLGFLSALIAGYLVGLIGSTNTPISGLLIINSLLVTLCLAAILKNHIPPELANGHNQIIAILIFIITIIGSAAIITNENIQDLKAGRMVGATPWKQQLMMMIGVAVSALVMAPILELLFQAYGMGGIFPHPGMNPNHMLLAPQANLLAAVTSGAIDYDLPWSLLGIGVAIGIGGIILDTYLKNKTKNKRTPPLAVGLGIYLPPPIVMAILLGGLVRYFADLSLERNKRLGNLQAEHRKHAGILFACGLIAGAALMGITLAIPFVIAGNSDLLHLFGPSFEPIAIFLSIIMTVFICVCLYRITVKKQ